MLIVGGVAGGAFFLIVVIAVAASSGSKPQRTVEKKVAAPAPVVVEEKPAVTKQDTGPITFACTGNGGKHPEKEAAVTRCPKCNARSRFFWDYKANKFSCFDCKALFEKADIKCPECGGTPNRDPYIKHRPG
jgi:Zn finger protein HypA/HybF involved in hydrogenase expression